MTKELKAKSTYITPQLFGNLQSGTSRVGDSCDVLSNSMSILDRNKELYVPKREYVSVLNKSVVGSNQCLVRREKKPDKFDGR